MRVFRAALVASWPFLASVAMVAIVVMSTVVVGTTFNQRDELARQSKRLQSLVEAEKRDLEIRQKQLDEAIDAAAVALRQILAEHDKRTGESHELMYGRISTLLGRPVPTTTPPAPPPTAPRTATTCPQAGNSGHCR